jgi:hypothetical protein
MHPVPKLASCLLLLAVFAAAQDSPGRKVPSVTLAPVPTTSITRGKPGTVELQFRVSSGFHINSNTPKSEFLIPTALKLNAPTDIVVGKVTYPAGVERTFPFAPDEKISVYSGDFALAVVIRPLAHVMPSKYALHGELKYQACDNAACYPPKKLPVDFEVKVVKAKVVVHKKNPGQSPHAHY